MPGKSRLDKLLANLGYGSRKDVGKAIKAGLIKRGDEILSDPSMQIDLATAKDITFEGQPLDPVSPLTVLLHKPAGYTCSTDEDGDLIYALMPWRWQIRTPVLSTAGRLDKDSTGLVLLTDDGQLLHKIISPKTHVAKHYRVTLRDALKGNEAALFSTGEFCMTNDTKPLKPATWVPEGERSGVMILQEGRYHQIRRMFSALGNHVETLHRFKIGGLDLSGVEEGQYKILDEGKIAAIFMGR